MRNRNCFMHAFILGQDTLLILLLYVFIVSLPLYSIDYSNIVSIILLTISVHNVRPSYFNHIVSRC